MRARGRARTDALRPLSKVSTLTSSPPAPAPTIDAKANLPPGGKGSSAKKNNATANSSRRKQPDRTSDSFANEAVAGQLPQQDGPRVSNCRRPRSAFAATRPRSSETSGADGVEKGVGRASRGGRGGAGAAGSRGPGRRPMVGGRSNAARPCNGRVRSKHSEVFLEMKYDTRLLSHIFEQLDSFRSQFCRVLYLLSICTL